MEKISKAYIQILRLMMDNHVVDSKDPKMYNLDGFINPEDYIEY